jgi:hypothetical protein
MPTYWFDIEEGEMHAYASGWNVKNPRTFAEWTGKDGAPSGGFIDFKRNIRIFFYHLFKHRAFQEEFRRTWKEVRIYIEMFQ